MIAFFRYFFYIKDDELIVQKGVFQRSVTNIPFERIQTINFEQSVLHQTFNVVKLEIDTAGSKGNEFSFAALDKPLANALRELILKNKAELKKDLTSDAMSVVTSPKEEVVMKLRFFELIKLGFVQNHLRSFLLIIVFFSWILQQLNEIGMDTDEMIGEIDPQTLFVGKIAVISLGLLAILATLLISLVRTILKYFDLKLLRATDGFKVESGLLNRKQIAAKDHKIQVVAWADNPLKRLLGVFDVLLKQASSVQVQNKRSIIIPGCEKKNLEKIKSYYFRDEEWMNLIDFGIHIKYLVRRFLYNGLLLFAVFFICTYYFFDWKWALITLLWLPLSLAMSFIRFRKWKIHINDHILYAQYGLFGNYNKVIKLYKVQSINLGQSLYHRWNDLCNITVYTASGNITIPFLPLEDGHALMDYLVYKIEVDKRSWM